MNKVIVRYNGRTVGYLAEIEEGRIVFQYDSVWIESGFSISTYTNALSDSFFQFHG